MSRMIAFVCTALSAFRPTHELWQRRSAYKSRVDERQFTTFAAARKPPIMIVTRGVRESRAVTDPCTYGSTSRGNRAIPGSPRAEVAWDASGRGLANIGALDGAFRFSLRRRRPEGRSPYAAEYPART